MKFSEHLVLIIFTNLVTLIVSQSEDCKKSLIPEFLSIRTECQYFVNRLCLYPENIQSAFYENYKATTDNLYCFDANHESINNIIKLLKEYVQNKVKDNSKSFEKEHYETQTLFINAKKNLELAALEDEVKPSTRLLDGENNIVDIEIPSDIVNNNGSDVDIILDYSVKAGNLNSCISKGLVDFGKYRFESNKNFFMQIKNNLFDPNTQPSEAEVNEVSGILRTCTNVVKNKYQQIIESTTNFIPLAESKCNHSSNAKRVLYSTFGQSIRELFSTSSNRNRKFLQEKSNNTPNIDGKNIKVNCKCLNKRDLQDKPLTTTLTPNLPTTGDLSKLIEKAGNLPTTGDLSKLIGTAENLSKGEVENFSKLFGTTGDLSKLQTTAGNLSKGEAEDLSKLFGTGERPNIDPKKNTTDFSTMSMDMTEVNTLIDEMISSIVKDSNVDPCVFPKSNVLLNGVNFNLKETFNDKEGNLTPESIKRIACNLSGHLDKCTDLSKDDKVITLKEFIDGMGGKANLVNELKCNNNNQPTGTGEGKITENSNKSVTDSKQFKSSDYCKTMSSPSSILGVKEEQIKNDILNNGALKRDNNDSQTYGLDEKAQTLKDAKFFCNPCSDQENKEISCGQKNSNGETIISLNDMKIFENLEIPIDTKSFTETEFKSIMGKKINQCGINLKCPAPPQPYKPNENCNDSISLPPDDVVNNLNEKLKDAKIKNDPTTKTVNESNPNPKTRFIDSIPNLGACINKLPNGKIGVDPSSRTQLDLESPIKKVMLETSNRYINNFSLDNSKCVQRAPLLRLLFENDCNFALTNINSSISSNEYLYVCEYKIVDKLPTFQCKCEKGTCPEILNSCSLGNPEKFNQYENIVVILNSTNSYRILLTYMKLNSSSIPECSFKFIDSNKKVIDTGSATSKVLKTCVDDFSTCAGNLNSKCFNVIKKDVNDKIPKLDIVENEQIEESCLNNINFRKAFSIILESSSLNEIYKKRP